MSNGAEREAETGGMDLAAWAVLIISLLAGWCLGSGVGEALGGFPGKWLGAGLGTGSVGGLAICWQMRNHRPRADALGGTLRFVLVLTLMGFGGLLGASLGGDTGGLLGFWLTLWLLGLTVITIARLLTWSRCRAARNP